jgi:hypothetical protein
MNLTPVQKALLVFLTDPSLRSVIRSADPKAYEQAVRAAEAEGIACSEHAREPNGLSCTRCGKPSLIHGAQREPQGRAGHDRACNVKHPAGTSCTHVHHDACSFWSCPDAGRMT